jgi:hypothetical protein
LENSNKVTIEEAKKNLEDVLIFKKGVIGIGIVKISRKRVIEVSIDKSIKEDAIAHIIENGKWMGYQVVITKMNRIYPLNGKS